MQHHKNTDSDFVEFVFLLQKCTAKFSFVQNKLRNHLGLETASKLVTCYKLLNAEACRSLTGRLLIASYA